MDELPPKAGKVLFVFRKELLHKNPRHLAVLELLKKVSPLDKPAPHDHTYCLAIHESFGTVIEQVVEISMAKYGKIEIEKGKITTQNFNTY